MSERARFLIETLQLQLHPEGGWYRETFRSEDPVMPADGRDTRRALTAIYFMLEAGQHSRWHRVLSDEVWVHLEGDPLELLTWNAADGHAGRHVLAPVASLPSTPQCRPQEVVPAGLWQAARPLAAADGVAGSHTLVACMVAPGFDFSDFSLMDPAGAEARSLSSQWPALAALI